MQPILVSRFLLDLRETDAHIGPQDGSQDILQTSEASLMRFRENTVMQARGDEQDYDARSATIPESSGV